MPSVVMTLTDKNTNELDIQVDFEPEINGKDTLPYSHETVIKFLSLFEPDRISANKRQLQAILRRRPFGQE